MTRQLPDAGPSHDTPTSSLVRRAAAPAHGASLLRAAGQLERLLQRGPGREHDARAAAAAAAAALLASLLAPEVRTALTRAAAAFEEGADVLDGLERWVGAAVRARAVLEEVATTGWIPTLPGQLRALDDAFDDRRGAVMLLAPGDYSAALGSSEPPLRSWWGERRRVAATVTERALCEALARLRGARTDTGRPPSRA